MLPWTHCWWNHSLILHTYIIHDYWPSLILQHYCLLLIQHSLLCLPQFSYNLHRVKRAQCHPYCTLLIVCMQVFTSSHSLKMLKVLRHWRLQAHTCSKLMCLKGIQTQGPSLLSFPLPCSLHIFELHACFSNNITCGCCLWLFGSARATVWEKKKTLIPQFVLCELGIPTFHSTDRKSALCIMHFSGV